MSLTGALNTSFQGIRDAEAKLAVSSQNITNADQPGYTRKEYESTYTTVGDVTVPTSGSIESVVVDPYLQAQVVEDTSNAAKADVEAEYLTNYNDRIASVGGEDSVADSIDELTSSLDTLSVTPEDNSLKSQVVNDAENIADDLRQSSEHVQDLRLQADQEIAVAVNDINESLHAIDDLNKQIATAEAMGTSTADLKDQRFVELEKVAALTDVDYFIDSNNRMNIYIGGYPAVGAQVNELSYSPQSNVSSTVTYPGGFNEITISGASVTRSMDGGKIGGLLETRDVTLVEEQQKLDELATSLADEMNRLHNQGASIPPRTEMIGDTEGFAAGNTFTATGEVRIAITDQNGTVVNYNDFDLTTYGTIGDLVTDINTVLGPDVTASIDANGSLVLTANNAGEGISLSELDSSVGADGEGFSDFFGLNNMFDYTNGAEDIRVSEYLTQNSDYVSTSRLSDDPALANGDTGIFIGDGSLSKEMNEALDADISVDAAGNFAAQTTSLSAYADAIISDVAGRTASAESRADSAALLAEQSKNNLVNLTGVNTDEELTKVIDIEAKYDAAATMISTIQQLFDELINAVR